MSKEAMKLALEEYLCREMPAGTVIGDPKWWAGKIANILAKQEQGEPVAYRFRVNGHFSYKAYDVAGLVCEPLYTTPQQRKPLTDEQIANEFYKFEAASAWYQFARAIEAAHGIKE